MSADFAPLDPTIPPAIPDGWPLALGGPTPQRQGELLDQAVRELVRANEQLLALSARIGTVLDALARAPRS